MGIRAGVANFWLRMCVHDEMKQQSRQDQKSALGLVTGVNWQYGVGVGSALMTLK